MISINGKYIKNMGVYQGFEKNETATMFFLKKPSPVLNCHCVTDVKCSRQSLL